MSRAQPQSQAPVTPTLSVTSPANEVSADFFPELRPYYAFCVAGLVSIIAVLSFFASYNVAFLNSTTLELSVLAATMLALLGGWYGIYRRDVIAQSRAAEAARRAERPKTTERLSRWRAFLREMSGCPEAELLLVPGDARLIWTARGGAKPIVQMTSGFWAHYAANELALRGALGHEAGHVKAGDVRVFQQLRAGVNVSLVAVVFLFAVHCTSRMLRHAPTFKWLPMGILVLAAVVLAACLAWGALVVARETQADAYSALVLGDRAPIQSFLLTQQQLGTGASARRARVRAWLIQPALPSRAALVALEGRNTPKMEVMLGLATAAVMVTADLFCFYLLNDLRLFAGLRDTFASSNWVLLAQTSAVSWLTFQFFWFQSRRAARSLAGFVQELATWLRFCVPGTLLIAASLLLQSAGTGGPPNWLVIVSGSLALPVLAVLLWAAARGGLWFLATPSFARFAAAFGATAFLCALVTTIIMRWRPNQLLLPTLLPVSAALTAAIILLVTQVGALFGRRPHAD
jgi:Zn-dependent protease with chaperone function